MNYYQNCLIDEMSERNDIWEVKNWIEDCRIPLIRAFFKPYGIECDVTFNGIGVENTELFRYLLTIQPEARKLVVFMKNWLQINNIKLKGYVITLLCIFFLQVQDFLPSIELVQQYEEVFEVEGE